MSDNPFDKLGNLGDLNFGGGFDQLSKFDPTAFGKTALNTFRAVRARQAYNEALRLYDAETAEAVAAAVRAGHDPRAIYERADRQRAERAKREDLLKSPPPLHGSARWATPADLGHSLRSKEAFDDPRSILLGAVVDERLGHPAGFLHWDDDGHLLTVAPTRSGKSVTTIIPNLLRYKGSCVVIDPKGELYEATSKWRRTLGPVYRIAPFDDGSNPKWAGFPRHGYNPVARIRTFADARALATLMYPKDPRSPDFFVDDVVGFIAPLMWFLVRTAPPDRQNIGTVRAMTSIEPDMFRDVVLERMRTSGIPEVAQGAQAVRAKFGGNGNSLRTFLDTLNSKLAMWSDSSIVACTDRDDVDFGRLKDETATVYLTVPFKLLTPYAPFLKVVLTAALDAMQDNPRTPDIPVLFILDEFLALEAFPEFRNAIRTHAGAGVRLWFFLQDIGTLQEHYPGASWQTFFNCSVKQYFGTDEAFTGELISRFLGAETKAFRSTNESSNLSASFGGPQGSAGVNMSHGENISLMGRPLLMPNEVVSELSSWLPDKTRHSIVQLRTPPHPIKARLVPYDQSKKCVDRLGAWIP